MASSAPHATTSASNTESSVVRPTEAQLRWSQFHHKRRAVQVRSSLPNFYQSPATWEQVEGALSEDARSSSSSSSSSGDGSDTLREIRQRRPFVSKGRRALLRVSRRNYERRRQVIVEHGYQGAGLLTAMSGDEESDVDEQDAAHEDALNEIFMVESSRRRQRKRPRHRHRRQEDAGSFQRFQEACHAMMMNLAAPPKHSIAIPTRKWTRTVDAATTPFDQDYLDVKWGILKRPAGDAPWFPSDPSAVAPMDRGASWMMHLPTKAAWTARENPYYHYDPSLIALPPPSEEGLEDRDNDDAQSVASTLALQAPGAQKFHRLVSLVQQRMIQKHQEAQSAAVAAPTMKLRRGFGDVHHPEDESRSPFNEKGKLEHDEEPTDGGDAAAFQTPTAAGEFHSRRRPSFASPFSPSPGPVRERKAHYVPRMRLRDFVPEGTTEHELQELELNLKDGKGIPRTMKLRGFPSLPATSPRRRKSRAEEIAESFEPETEERRLSKTQQMAQPLEGDSKDNYPKMRLRSSFERQNDDGDEEEKKGSEDEAPGRLAASVTAPYDGSRKEPTSSRDLLRPTRSAYSPVGPSSRSVDDDDAENINPRIYLPSKVPRESGKGNDEAEEEGKPTIHSTSRDPKRHSNVVEKMGHAALKSTDSPQLQDPTRRKPHPLSNRFVEAMQLSQQPPTKEQIVIHPLPPGTCCARCAKKSPAAAAVSSSDGTNAFFASGPARVSDFFSQLRQGHPGSNATDDSHRRESTATAVTKSSATGSQRVSDFFNKVRQLGPNKEEKARPDGASADDVPLEETDFFAQVREMIATNDDDEESAEQRVSDFFAQVREMSEEMKQEQADLLCEECQVQDIEDTVESASVSLSPTHGSTVPVRSSSSQASQSTKTTDEDSKSDTKSDLSALSGLWNRGRSSLNQFASSLNAISEKTAQVAVINPQARLSASSMPGRVGGFLQRLQGKQDQEQQMEQAQGTEDLQGLEDTTTHKRDVNDTVTPHGDELEYSSLNDLEAMAAYRKSQEYKRLSGKQDDASSHSSYHVLPDGIREIVKRQVSSPSKPPPMVSSPSKKNNDPGSLNGNDASPRRNHLANNSSPNRYSPRREEGGLDADPTASALSRPSASSPGRVSITSSAIDMLSPEKYREAHGKVMRNSSLLGNVEQGVIDTDGTTSDASYSGMDPTLLASLMLSPDILQKRLHQAVSAIEGKHWDQVKYLLSANPWLAEMCELTTNQYLLHKISFFGASAPKELCAHLIEMFPSAVYKFDQDGNVPLHLAAAAGHLKMIRMLGEKFESGASIRNEDGMLPLHFTIASYADFEGSYDDDNEDENQPSPMRVIKTMLTFFPTAVAIGDNDGNLPIHVAAECLHGGFGVDVIYILLDEADRQLKDPYGARFYNKVKLEDIVNDDISGSTIPADGETASSTEEDIHCNMVKNDFGETPLLAAVRSRQGWDVIEALVSGPGGYKAALYEDSEKNNVLHLLLGEYQNPAAALSILKIVPETATMRNKDGMLPIEVACLQLMPEEVILSIALVDLPFDVDDKDSMKLRDEHGESWWFLVCECDDHYVDIVQQIVMICTFQQVQALCSMKSGSSQHKDAIMSRATPKCKQVLAHASRFLGRFELTGNTPVESDSAIGLKVFDALDFADSEEYEEGRRVTLKCYANIEAFRQATGMLREVALDPHYVEETFIFGDGEHKGGPEQLCVCIECPQVTLDRVVDGMTKKGGYMHDAELRKKYAAKMCAVLRLIAKAISHLHNSGVIHGNICMQTCGKFEHYWKLLDSLRVQRIGEFIKTSRYEQSFPPEVLDLDEDDRGVYDSDNAAVSFLLAKASVSIDIWAFGKLAYETLVGKPLVEFDRSKKTTKDVVALLEILEWDQSNMKAIFSKLLDSGVTDSCAELITSCLFPRPEDRPDSMDAILDDPFWKDMRQYRERSPPSKRSNGETASNASPKSIFTETASPDTTQEIETAEI